MTRSLNPRSYYIFLGVDVRALREIDRRSKNAISASCFVKRRVDQDGGEAAAVFVLQNTFLCYEKICELMGRNVQKHEQVEYCISLAGWAISRLHRILAERTIWLRWDHENH